MLDPNETRPDDADLLDGIERLIDLTGEIRDYVNERRVHAALMPDTVRYNRVCAAMDMIGDTAQALRAYVQHPPAGGGKGSAYLTVFGALQALYVQQDAVFWLLHSLGYPAAIQKFGDPGKWIQTNEGLNEVRDLRNSSIGHPVTRNRGRVKASFFITQMTLSVSGFQLLAYNDAGERPQFISVHVPDLIRKQMAAFHGFLSGALDEARAAEHAHRQQFKHDPLASTFDSLSYPLEKLGEATRDGDIRSLGMYGVDAVRGVMQTFRERLSARGEPFDAGLQLIYDRLDAALRQLEGFCQSTNDTTLALADVLSEFVADRVDELRDWASELDEKYAEPVES